MRHTLLIIILYEFYFTSAQENVCIINGKKSLNTVSKELISVSIDPAMVLSPQSTFKNTSIGMSLKMARHLAPGFIRISGPSTEFLQFSDTENVSLPNRVTVTPALWKSFNNWARKSGLTPVIAVNDKYRDRSGSWNLNDIAPFLRINNALDFPCYWQVGHDCKDKTLLEYKNDLQAFRSFLDTHATRQLYKIVGSNLHSCLSHRSPELVTKLMEDLEYDADAIVWESDFTKSAPYLSNTYMPVWLSIPKDTHPITFESSLKWAKQIGEAAKAGYKVIFRQPRIHELHSPTPVYWVSLLYKTLMGQTVLDVYAKNQNQLNAYMYAQCTRNQTPNQGAVTLLMINNDGSQYRSFVRLASTSQPKIVDVETYILTSEKYNSRNIYLNDVKLTMDDLLEYPYKPIPKIRHVKVDKLLSLSVPAKSMGFFVLRVAKIKACIDATEHALTSKEPPLLIMEEKYKPQNLEDVYESMNKEIKEDEVFYKHETPKQIDKHMFRDNRILKDTKLMRNQNRFKLPLHSIFDTSKTNNNDLQLTKAEIKKVLTDRAKRVITGNVASSETQSRMAQTKKRLKMRQRHQFLRLNPPHHWMKSFRNKTAINRIKRDINMDLLGYKNQRFPQTRFKNRKINPYRDEENFESVQQYSLEEDFNSQESEFIYNQKQSAHHKDMYGHVDERLQFLSEADRSKFSRIPRNTNAQRNNKNTPVIHHIQAKLSNSKRNAAREKLIAHLKERKQKRIEKRKQHNHRVNKIKNIEKGMVRDKRMIVNEYEPHISNSAQTVEKNSWMSRDILNMKKSAPSVEKTGNIERLQISNRTNLKNIQKRSTDVHIIEENDIEYPFNRIYKDGDLYFEDNPSTVLTSTTLKTTKKHTSVPILNSDHLIDIISDTQSNDKIGNIQQTKVSINEDTVSNMIVTVTNAILQNLAATFSSVFSSI